MSIIRKYHNHKLQTNVWYRKEEPHNNHETPGRQTKQTNQLSVSRQDDCKTKIDKKFGMGTTYLDTPENQFLQPKDALFTILEYNILKE